MKTLKKKQATLLISLIFIANLAFSQTTFKFGGYAKFDNIFTRYNNGKPVSGIADDFHIPSLIPVGADDVNYNYGFHIKESRFNFDVTSKINNKPVRAFIEMDFMLSPGGNVRVSNSYNPRIRHFFFTYNNFLFGQTWSTFMIVTLPNDLDFVGSAEGVVFQRQPQMRYTLKGENGNWQFALENPQYTITNAPAGYNRNVVSGGIPDAIVRKNFKPSWGTFSVAAIVRGINYFDTANTRGIIPGYGITTGGKIKVGSRDDIRMTLTAGNGLGRYVGLNFMNAAMLDTANSVNTINSVNGYIAYLLHWSDKFQSSFNASLFFGDNGDAPSNAAINKNAQSYSVNLLYTPSAKLMFGIEYMYASRELQNGTKGDMSRVQFSAKYVFGYSHTTQPKE